MNKIEQQIERLDAGCAGCVANIKMREAAQSLRLLLAVARAAEEQECDRDGCCRSRNLEEALAALKEYSD